MGRLWTARGFHRVFRRCFSSGDKQSEWTSNKVRRTFLEYFSSQGYSCVQSSSVVPFDDRSLLYVNAGMNQFKPIFLGTVSPTDPRSKLRLAVNSQKCVRASGKHSDIDEVGRDGYHHTFFEMLGSWSFNGHLPKKKACEQALRLLVDVYGLPKDRLYVTYFEGYEPLGLLPDTECKELWKELGVAEDHVLGRGIEENFWEMGSNSGPCGPCTEILYSGTNPPRPDVTVELWNIVFMQFNKLHDGKLAPLPAMHIDTGMGLERLCSVLQGVRTTYDTDLFEPLLAEICKQSGAEPYAGRFGDADLTGMDTAYRIVADHARMFTVAIADGIVPDSQKAGYVLRRIVRNAAYQATLLNAVQNRRWSLGSLCNTVANILGDAYPELYDGLTYVREVVSQEEAKFLTSMKKSKARLQMLLKDKGGNLSTSDLANLYFTYGLPYYILVSMLSKSGVKLDAKEFQQEIEKHKQKSGPFPGAALSVGEAELAAVIADLQV